jgi:hypothetical protein
MIRQLRSNCFVLVALVVWPTMAMGQVSLTELGAANAARNQMMANGANAAAGAAPQHAAAPRPAAPSVGFGGMKYVLSYALTGMLMALGMYLTCRPANRHEAD